MKPDDTFLTAANEASSVLMEKHHVNGTEMTMDGTDFLLCFEIQEMDFETAFFGQSGLNSRYSAPQNGMEFWVLAIII